MPITRIIKPLRGPFAFPGRKAGVDLTNPASSKLRFSGVASGSNFRSVYGPVGSVSGSPTASTLPWTGQGAGYATTAQSSFSGMSTVNDESNTLAAIVFLTTLPAGTTVAVSSSDTITGGVGLSFNSSAALFYIRWGRTNATSSLTVSTNVPYFIAMSGDSLSESFVLRRLDNGVLRTDSTAIGTPTTAPSGTFAVGNNGGSRPLNGIISAAMMSGTRLSLQQLIQWSADPWSFWYPK